jgi:acetyl-CoA C-acetyltransferase
MSVDWSRVPVVVGAGQVTNRDTDPASAPGPFDLMERAARCAADSSGAVNLDELTHLWMVHSLSVRHPDPAGHLAGVLKASAAETRCSGMGGSIPQWLVDRACELVVSGERPRVLVVGAEALATRRRAKRAGVALDWPSAPGWPDTWPPIEPDLGVHPTERAHGLDQATAMYALVETALGHRSGSEPREHLRTTAELMARFNEVAAANPYSWFGQRRDADELARVSDDNRMIYFPYPKYLNAVMDVDMAAAVVLTDAATAREAGLGPEDVVYVTGWADAHDVWYLSERPAVERSEALSACGRHALEQAGLGLDQISAFDLYSCFPSSVEVARDCLGIDRTDPRPLTLTGGLPYHGGPGSNYVSHAIANGFDWLRSGRGDHVLVHGNGYYLTKHAVGVYSRSAPRELRPAASAEAIQAEADGASTPVQVDGQVVGRGTVVAYTAPYTREGVAKSAIVLVQLAGSRTVARADDELTAQLLDGRDGVGTAVSISSVEDLNSARPA